MKAVKIILFSIAIALTVSACGKAKNKVTLEDAKAGRDKELFESGIKAIRKGSYDEGRILLNTMINTYPDSPLTRVAKLANADSFYLQGGSKALAQAEVEYNDWVQFFPKDDLSDDIFLKMAEIHLKQVQDHNRDTTHARQAEQRLKEMVRRYPDSDRKGDAEGLMNDVQEILGMHELGVARFYFVHRKAATATQLRTEEILKKYPNFSLFDEALWLHAQAMAMQEDTETASNDLSRLVTNYPHSEFREKAEALLKSWGKPVPESDPVKLAQAPTEGKGMMSRTVGFLFGPKIGTSNKGVIIDRDLSVEEIVARAEELAGGPKAGGPVTPGAATTSNNDSRPRRASGASQDVEVKPGTATNEKEKASSNKKNDKKDKKDKDKKTDGGSPVLRNP